LYSANTVGWNWDYPGQFTLVNFDEGGSCRAALQGFDYSPVVGWQTIAIASALGNPPAEGVAGDVALSKAYCHSAEHILVARNFSAVLGALTPILLIFLGLQLLPGQINVALTAGFLLALSGFHISSSHTGTVDAPSIFYIYAFIACLVAAIRSGRWRLYFGSAILLLAAVWTKYWVFASLALLAFTPLSWWRLFSHGLTKSRIVVLIVMACFTLSLATNSDFRQTGWWFLLGVFYFFVPWRRIHRLTWPLWIGVPVIAVLLSNVELFAIYSMGSMESAFGSGYGAIGWNKWARNFLNIPLVLIVGLGLPAFIALVLGIRELLLRQLQVRAWLCLMPLVAFFLFMTFLAPVTYYRHYLALLPAAALVASLGFFTTRFANKPWAVGLFLFWPALLAIDLELDFHKDPRIAMREWYTEVRPERVFTSFYVNPPPAPARVHQLFSPDYAVGKGEMLLKGQYLVLSENWYDTAFANELNGPITLYLDRLIKTKPEYAAFYRQAIEGRHPLLQEERVYEVSNFMPELWLHKKLYGTFQMFVGDIRIFRIGDYKDDVESIGKVK
jgi:hypothetical protein